MPCCKFENFDYNKKRKMTRKAKPFIFTVSHLHDMLSLSKGTIRKYLREGKLGGRKIGGRFYVIDKNLKKFLDKNDNFNKIFGKGDKLKKIIEKDEYLKIFLYKFYDFDINSDN